MTFSYFETTILLYNIYTIKHIHKKKNGTTMLHGDMSIYGLYGSYQSSKASLHIIINNSIL